MNQPFSSRTGGRWLLIFSFLCGGTSAQVLIDKRITVQPIYISNGTTSANPGGIQYKNETNKIWSQAGIDIDFLEPVITYVNNTYYTNLSTNDGDSNSLLSLYQTPSQSWSTTNLSTNIVRLFFVPIIDNDTNLYGNALQTTVSSFFFAPTTPVVSSNGYAMAVSNSAISINRIDVIAHELGHLLGLDHASYGAGGATNLMSSPRTSPTSISEIFPSGSLDLLTGGAVEVGNPNWKTEQIDRARVIPIAVTLPENQQYIYGAIPEPGSTTAIAGAIILALAGFISWRRVKPTQPKDSLNS